MFEKILARRNHVGLLSEDLDPATGELWGNFPQTYSLVGIILSAMRLSEKLGGGAMIVSATSALFRGCLAGPARIMRRSVAFASVVLIVAIGSLSSMIIRGSDSARHRDLRAELIYRSIRDQRRLRGVSEEGAISSKVMGQIAEDERILAPWLLCAADGKLATPPRLPRCR